ncbi:MAG: FMN-binding protein [Eubacteriales bacterium]
MKKILKRIGIGSLAFFTIILVYAFLGKDKTLALQIGSVDLSNISDGKYTGVYDCFRWSNTVTVTVSNHRIMDIKIVKAPNGRDGIQKILEGRIIDVQSPAVDAVSGATADSNAFLKAVENALQNTQPSS